MLNFLEGKTLELLQDRGGAFELPWSLGAMLEIEHRNSVLVQRAKLTAIVVKHVVVMGCKSLANLLEVRADICEGVHGG